MTVLLTGATGFVGGHLTTQLLRQGTKLRLFALPGEDVTRLEHENVEVSRGNLTDRASVQAAVEGVDCVLHCAARTGPWGPEKEYEQVNVFGTRYLVEAAMAAGVRRIVHVSSITVHGVDIHGTADEEAPLRGGSDPYSKTKTAAELILQQLIRSQAAPVTIVRPGLIYGPGDTNSFGRFARLIEQGRMVYFGSGNNHLPLIHVRDVVRGIILASEVDEAVGKAYLLVNDEPVTQRDYFEAIAKELGVPLPRLRIPYRLALALGASAEAAGHLLHMKQPPITRFGLMQIGGENHFMGNRARIELGFCPQVHLVEGVRESIAWYRGTQSSAKS